VENFRITLEELVEEIRKARRVVVVGVGNTLRGDDGVGVLVARRLAEKGFKGKVIVAGPNPELFIRNIASAKPDLTVFVDAVDAGLEPGSIVVSPLTGTGTAFPPLSTHAIPLPMLAALLGSKSYLIGIQVEKTDFCSRMSPRVREAAETLVEFLLDALRN